MRIQWNQYEVVPLDVGDDPLDYVVEFYDPKGNSLTVKRTQFSTSGETFITLNGRAGATKSPEPLISPIIIDRYAIRVFSYENDTIPSHEASILSYELKGKCLRIRADVSL